MLLSLCATIRDSPDLGYNASHALLANQHLRGMRKDTAADPSPSRESLFARGWLAGQPRPAR